MARRKLQVFQIFDDYEQLTETKYFNSHWLRAAYMRALRNRYEGDEFSSKLYRVFGAAWYVDQPITA